MQRLLIAPLLALIFVATADAQTRPAFTERDRLAAITALAGRVTAGTARDGLGGTPTTINGFVTAGHTAIYVELLSATFRQAGRSQHLLVLGRHPVNAGAIDHRLTTQTDVFVGVSEFRNGRWEMTSKGAPVATTGFSGRDPVAVLRKIGSDRHALELQSHLWSEGSSLSLVNLYDLRGTQPAELLRVVTAANDCGFSDSCFAFEGALTILAKPGAPRPTRLDVVMMTMNDDVMRTIIDLPGDQLDGLDRWRKREGVSRAEAIRRAVALLIQGQGESERQDAFGIWAKKPIDGLAYEATVRADWAQRRPTGKAGRQ